jgi:transposase-like protein
MYIFPEEPTECPACGTTLKPIPVLFTEEHRFLCESCGKQWSFTQNILVAHILAEYEKINPSRN